MENNIMVINQDIEKANKNFINKDFDIAIELYTKALNDLDNVDNTDQYIGYKNNILYNVNYNLGVCYIKLKDYKTSIIYNKEAIKHKGVNNKMYNAFYNLAYSYICIGNSRDGLENINIAYGLNSSDLDIIKLYNKLTKAYTIDSRLEELI